MRTAALVDAALGVLQVTAVQNDHYHLPGESVAARNRSYALRFKTRDRVVVLTGDTGASDAVATLATHADVLVSEMATASDLASVPPEVRHHVESEHLSPAQVGQMASITKVKQVVLSHVRKLGPSDVDEVRRAYKGIVTLGDDLRCY